jgi:hypothetical protein
VPLLAPPHEHLYLLRASTSPTALAAVRYRSRPPSPFRQRRCCPEHRAAAPRRHPHPPGPRRLDPSSEPPGGGLLCRGLPRPPRRLAARPPPSGPASTSVSSTPTPVRACCAAASASASGAAHRLLSRLCSVLHPGAELSLPARLAAHQAGPYYDSPSRPGAICAPHASAPVSTSSRRFHRHQASLSLSCSIYLIATTPLATACPRRRRAALTGAARAQWYNPELMLPARCLAKCSTRWNTPPACCHPRCATSPLSRRPVPVSVSAACQVFEVMPPR